VETRRARSTIADLIIGLGITLVILRITRQSWGTIRGHHSHQRTQLPSD
jgi:hypothetical protein